MSIKTKRCVRCKQQDTTEFSSCRFCGTKYDAVLPQAKMPGTSFGAMLRSWPSLIVILILAVVLKGPFCRTCMFVFSGGHTLNQVVEESVRPVNR